MADHFSLVISCIDSVLDRVRGRSSKRWQLNEHQCSYLAEELLKVSQSLQAKLESGNFKPVRGIQKIVLLLHAAVKRAQLLVERCFCETSSSWRVSVMTSTDIREEVITIVLNLHKWTSVLDIAIASVEGRPSKENLEFLKTWEEGYQRLFKKLHSSKHPLQVAALQDQKALLANIAECTEDDYAYGVYLKSRLAPMGGEVQSVPQLEHYKVSRPLGQGASGMVLEVTWMGHRCGLKISKGSEKTEATILDRLHHPNIVRFFHYWEVPPPDRNSYMVMELLPSDLHKHISRELSRPSSQSHKKGVGMPFLLSVAIDLMLQGAQAMQHVHDQKLTHRDLKTSNILVKPVPESMSELHSQGYLEVKLADFGLAKGYLDSSISGGLTRNMGTTVYGAPEIFGQEETQTHKNFPRKADVWSFGMVCWEILTGRVPFSEESSKAELHKRIRFEGLRPRFPKDCPAYLQFCIASCWELQPERRPKFTDLCRMLRHAQLLNLGLICLEDTGSWFGYSDRAGLMNTMSISSTSSAVEPTKSWFRAGIGLISNFLNVGLGYKPMQPAIEDSNDHTIQPTREIECIKERFGYGSLTCPETHLIVNKSFVVSTTPQNVVACFGEAKEQPAAESSQYFTEDGESSDDSVSHREFRDCHVADESLDRKAQLGLEYLDSPSKVLVQRGFRVLIECASSPGGRLAVLNAKYTRPPPAAPAPPIKVIPTVIAKVKTQDSTYPHLAVKLLAALTSSKGGASQNSGKPDSGIILEDDALDFIVSLMNK